MSMRKPNPKDEIFKDIQFMKGLRCNEVDFRVKASPEALMVAGVEDGAWYANNAMLWLEGKFQEKAFNMDHVLKLADMMQREAHFAEKLRYWGDLNEVFDNIGSAL